MRNILIVARKEIQEGLRNRWVLATTLLLAALALTLTFLGSAPTGNVGVRALDVVIVSLSSLTIFLLPLIALLISHDAIVGEMERGTMLLLLSYPVARWQVLLGKFVGHLSILAFATLLGYGAAAGALAATGAAIDAESWAAFASMIGSSILLGAAFIAMGYLVSALVRERGTAGGIAIGIWLVFVLIYDMALLGLLVVDQGQVALGRIAECPAAAQPDRRLPPVQPDRLRQRQRVLRHGRGRADHDAGPVRPARRAGRLGPAAARAGGARLLQERAMRKTVLLAAFAGALALAGCNDREDRRGPAAAAGADGRGHRPLLRHERARAHRAQGADHPGEPQGSGLVLLGARRDLVHPAAGGAEGHPRDLRLRHGQGAELGRARREQLGRCEAGLVRDRQPEAGRHGRRRGGAVLRQERRREIRGRERRTRRGLRRCAEGLCPGRHRRGDRIRRTRA